VRFKAGANLPEQSDRQASAQVLAEFLQAVQQRQAAGPAGLEHLSGEQAEAQALQ